MLWIKASYDLGYINKSIKENLLNEYKILAKKISAFAINIKKH